MDGRRLRRWVLCGGLVAAAAGCNRNSYHDNFGFPKPGQTVGALTPTAGTMPSPRSMWPAGQTPPPGTVAPAPVEAAKPKKPGQGLQPDTEASLADTHVAAALADPPPSNRDELLDMARMRYQRALQKDPKNAAALLGLARMYAKLGDREHALEVFKKYTATHPKDHAVLHELALVHGQWKDWNGAVGWAEAALKADPENRSYRKTLGFCQARAGKWEEGFANLCRVMPEAQARVNIAGLMDHMGMADACRQQLQLALQADPGCEGAKEFLAELDQAATQPAGPAVPGNPDPNPIRRTGYTPQQ